MTVRNTMGIVNFTPSFNGRRLNMVSSTNDRNQVNASFNLSNRLAFSNLFSKLEDYAGIPERYAEVDRERFTRSL